MQKKYGFNDFEIIDEQICHQGFLEVKRFSLKHKKFDGSWSAPMQREVSTRGSAAAAIVYDPRLDSVCVLEQFRVATQTPGESPWSFEIVAGLLDKPDESPEQLIRRELYEEAGITASYLEKITSYWVSPGGSAARMHLFVALADLSAATGVYGLADENEDILVHVEPLKSVHESAIAGGTSNAASLIALQWLTMNREPLYDRWLKTSENKGS